MAGLIDSLDLNQQLELIYIGYFNRSADSGGFQFWLNQNTTAQHSGQSASGALTNIANSFAPQAETEALYPFLATGTALNPKSPVDQASVSNLINSIYQNLFGHAPDASGGAYWSNQILTGAVGLGAVVLAIANGATGADAIEVQNKIAVALDFTTETAAAGQGHSPNAAFLAAAKNVLAGVDNLSLNDASVTAAEAKTAAFVASGAATAQTFTLTTGPDTPSLTANNNTINGTINGTGATLTPGDTLNGGTTTGNVLNLVDLGTSTKNAANLATSLSAVTISGIQTVNILSGEAIFANIASSPAGFAGLTQLNVTEANNGVASTIAAAATTNISVTDASQASGALSVQGGLNVTVATTEVASGAGEVTVGGTTAPAGTVTVTATAAPASPGAFQMGPISVTGGASTTSVTVDQTAPVAGGVTDGQVTITDANYSGGAKLGVITTVSLDGLSGANNAINDSALANLTVNDAASGASVTITEGSYTSPATTLALSLNNDAGLTLNDSGNKYTTVNLTLGAAADTLSLIDTALTTLKISGPSSGSAGALTLLSISPTAPLTSIDASGDNGNLTFTDYWAGAVVKGGSGNDLVTLAAALTTTSGGSIDFGAGDNSLLAGLGGSIGAGVAVDGGSSGDNTISAALVNLGNAAGIKDFQILDVSGYGGSLDTSLLSTPITGVAIGAAPLSTAGTATLLNLAAAVTVTDTNANDSSSLTLTHAAGSATNSLAIDFAGASTTATNETINTLTSTGDTTIAISSGGASTQAGYYNAINNLSETDNQLTTITITGVHAFDLNGVSTDGVPTTATASSLTKIDGHLATGALTINAGGTANNVSYTGLTILGGTGGDTITNYAANGVITEGATAATLVNTLTVSGSGAIINDQASLGVDIINLSGVNETANLGGGGTAATSTTVNVFNATSAAPFFDTVNFGSGIATVNDYLAYNTTGNLLALNGAPHGDILVFTNPIANPAGALGAPSISSILSSAQNLDQAVHAAQSPTANTVTWFQYGGNTYIEDSGSTPTSTVGAEVVKITGIVDLSNATFAGGHLTFA